MTTIWFFDLNHQDLTSRRAEMLGPLWGTLESRRHADNDADREFAEETIRLACSEAGQFSACMRAFCDLYDRDRVAAREKARLARQLSPPANAPVTAPA